MKKINVKHGFSKINEYWKPKIAAELNGQHIRFVKIKGKNFEFHKHIDNDEMFFVVKGRIVLEFENSKVDIGENEFAIVPKGVLHRPVADEEAHLMMFVTNSNINTGDVSNNMTLDTSSLKKIQID